MKKYSYFSALYLAAALAFTACTQDELTDDTLPEGMYPLEIASATIEAESSVQLWGAKTRVSEFLDNPLLNGWTTYDKFYVKFAGSDQIGTYEITEAGSGTATAVTPAYWQSASTEQTIIAWYAPQQAGTIDLSDQSKGRIYVMRAETKATYNNTSGAVSLKFEHQLAKVRVTFSGGNASKVSEVKIPGYTQCTLTENKEVSTADAQTGYITMYKMVLANTFEATVAPGCKINEVKVNGATATLTQPIIPGKGEYCEIKITVNPIAVTSGATISEPGDYIVTGNVTETITLNGEGINLTLKDANISVSSGNGIDITGGSPTIRVEGRNIVKNTATSSGKEGAGIYVASGSTVTITGTGRDDVLTAQTGVDAAGIGGCSNKQDCGSININNVTVIARSASYSFCSPGIGSTQTNKCGDITIDNATVHAYGTGFSNTCACPGIGAGLDISGNTGTISPNVTIKNNSEVHAHRGNNYADYIGISYFMTSGGGQVRATITGSTVYCYTGDSDTSDKTIEYDADGTGTEQ